MEWLQCGRRQPRAAVAVWAAGGGASGAASGCAAACCGITLRGHACTRNQADARPYTGGEAGLVVLGGAAAAARQPVQTCLSSATQHAATSALALPCSCGGCGLLLMSRRRHHTQRSSVQSAGATLNTDPKRRSNHLPAHATNAGSSTQNSCFAHTHTHTYTVGVTGSSGP